MAHFPGRDQPDAVDGLQWVAYTIVDHQLPTVHLQKNLLYLKTFYKAGDILNQHLEVLKQVIVIFADIVVILV